MEINILQSTTSSYEIAFSSKKYFALALAITAIATALLPISIPVSTLFYMAAGWYFWSAAIIHLNRFNTKPFHHLHAIAMEINCAIAAAFLFPHTLLKHYHAPKGNLQGQPILMINGYLSFGSTWHYQRQRLIESGFGPIYTINIGTGRSIKTYAEQVQRKVAKIQNETGKNDLILIGHSKGGLVSTYYATHLADEKTKISHIITIGSPLSGTPLAYFGPGVDAAEMRSRASFHLKLREKIQQCAHIQFYHIASQADAVVPSSSALLGTDASRHFLIKDLGHLGLVFSSRVADQICSWLTPNASCTACL